MANDTLALVYLAQTDTTAGLLSTDAARLNAIKCRPLSQPIIRTSPYLMQLHRVARVPARYRNTVRKSSRTTYIYPNGQSFRVVMGEHAGFFRRYNLAWAYSTSANKHGTSYDPSIAALVDVVDGDICDIYQSRPSRMIRLGRSRAKRLR